jgi:hypothetical protein
LTYDGCSSPLSFILASYVYMTEANSSIGLNHQCIRIDISRNTSRSDMQ